MRPFHIRSIVAVTAIAQLLRLLAWTTVATCRGLPGAWPADHASRGLRTRRRHRHQRPPDGCGVGAVALHTSVQVVNRPGAGSQVALTQLVRAKPDGYTLSYIVIPTVVTHYLDPTRGAIYTRASFQTIGRHYQSPETSLRYVRTVHITRSAGSGGGSARRIRVRSLPSATAA